MLTGHIAEMVERTVVVTCPDNDHGGVALPADGWEDRAHATHPTLHAVEGPMVSGCYALRWRDDPASNDELIARSLRIIRAEPAATPA